MNHEKSFRELLATEIRFGCLEYDKDGAYYPIYRGGARFGKSRAALNHRIQLAHAPGTCCPDCSHDREKTCRGCGTDHNCAYVKESYDA